MTDQRFRELQRRHLSGDPNARTAILAMRMRTGSAVWAAAMAGDTDAMRAVYGRVEPLHSVIRGPDDAVHALEDPSPSFATIYADTAGMPVVGMLQGRGDRTTILAVCGAAIPRAGAEAMPGIATCPACRSDRSFPVITPDHFFSEAWAEALAPIGSKGHLGGDAREFCIRVAIAAAQAADVHAAGVMRSFTRASIAMGRHWIERRAPALERAARNFVLMRPANVAGWRVSPALMVYAGSGLREDGTSSQAWDAIQDLRKGLDEVVRILGADACREAVAREVSPWLLD